MKKTSLLVFICGILLQINAQNFVLRPPKRHDTKFSEGFIKVFNQAPASFKDLKGSRILGTDEIHLGSQIYQSKIKLTGSKVARLVQDSTLYMEFFFGDFPSMQQALLHHQQLLFSVFDALNKHAYFHENKTDTASKLVRETKIAYMQRNGFYHYNTAVQTIRIAKTGAFRVLLQLYYGKPVFYNRIVYEPIGSFILINSIVNNLPLLLKNGQPGCPVALPTLECKGRSFVNDTISTTYYKSGFQYLPNAHTEFDALLTQLRVALGSEYVYFNTNHQFPVLQSVAFVMINDIEKAKRTTVVLSLKQEKCVVADSEADKQEAYTIELSFLY